jgi:hypothetical protein
VIQRLARCHLTPNRRISLTDGFDTHLTPGQALLEAHLRSQHQGPLARRFAKEAWALVQQDS